MAVEWLCKKEIYNEFLQQGLNSNIKGIRTKAEQGTGNYSFKGASAVSFNEATTMKNATMKSLTRGENTLVDGELPNGKHVYFAGKTESSQIQTLLEKRNLKQIQLQTFPITNVPQQLMTGGKKEIVEILIVGITVTNSRTE